MSRRVSTWLKRTKLQLWICWLLKLHVVEFMRVFIYHHEGGIASMAGVEVFEVEVIQSVHVFVPL